jgi:hypothetical protein
MNVRDIIMEKLDALGADGLCTEDCGCEYNCLAPCENCFVDCIPAYYNPKDGLFYPLEGKPEEPEA